MGLWADTVAMKVAVLFLIILVTTSQVCSQTALYSSGEPSANEQFYLELINRARANPTAEGQLLAASGDADVARALQSYGVNIPLMRNEFAALPPRPPLAMNAKLLQMARAHTQDLFANAIQSHSGSNGSSLSQRANTVSYPFASIGENVFSYAESVFQGHAGFQVDWGQGANGMQEGRGHRMNIHGNYREIGVGVIVGTNRVQNRTVGPQLVTQNFGTQQSSPAFITGVAYYDLNNNNFYDPGEGIGGLRVEASGASFHSITSNSGGYAIPVPTTNAQRSVTFAGPNLTIATSGTIANGENVKVDFKPVYTAPTPTGPTQVSTTAPSSYIFAPVGGATAHQWQALKITAIPDDEAENLTRVTVATSGNYNPRNTAIKHSGSAAYRLTHPTVAFSSELLTYNSTFIVRPGASLSFQSRLRMATVNQFAKVQVSTNNGFTWQDVYSQKGATQGNQNGQSGEANFTLRTVSLAAFVGQEIQIRFNYHFAGGTLFPGTGETFGWYIDRVKFNQLVDPSNAVQGSVAEGLSGFAFQPSTPGDYLLSVRPVIGTFTWPFSPPLTVTALAGQNPTPLVITSQPQDLTVKVGAAAALSVAATPANLAYQWKKNSANVPNANQPVFILTTAQLADAGTYRVEITDGAMNAVLSDPAQLGVVEDVPRYLPTDAGKSAKLTVTAAGPALSYQWKKDNQPLNNGPTITGTQTATLNLKNLQSNQTGIYTCDVRSGNSLPVEGGTTGLVVTGGVPSITLNQTMGDAIVGGSYQYTILYTVPANNPPSTFRAKGLPPGLKLDAKTGIITGTPTKTGLHKITLIAANSYGASETTVDLFVYPFPLNLSGNYIGLMINDPTLNQQLGGRLDLKVTALGTYTGTLTQGTIKTPFKGKLNVILGSQTPSTNVVIQPVGSPSPAAVTLTLHFDLDQNIFAPGSQINQGNITLPISGWRQIWHARTNAATVYQGLHTFALKPPNELLNNDEVPQGHGFGSFNGAADGKVKITGRLGDGEKYTAAAFIGPKGEIPIYQTLYAGARKGSILGAFVIQPGLASEAAGKTLVGALHWTRPPNNQASARTYREGFGLIGTPIETPLLVTATGAFYQPPQGTDAVILNLQASTNNAQLELAQGDLPATTIPLNIARQNKITAAANAPLNFKLTVNPKTGLLTGSFTDNGGNPSAPKQKVTMQGILTRENDQPMGFGYFLRPTGPTPSPIKSGNLILRPVP